MPVLRIKLPDNKGEVTHVLSGERITVGRRPENTIQIVDRTVSAHHAEFVVTGDHYRLHDLGSTNLTCVEGQPITDFHLHSACKVNFGSVECEFSPETPASVNDKTEVVPTRAEMEFFRRENLDLQAKIVSMQKQIDILSSARLMTKDTQKMGVMPDVHRRVQQERDELRIENSNLKLDIENLRNDIAHLTKERDALRLAWTTARNERDSAFSRLVPDSGDGTASISASEPVPEVSNLSGAASDGAAVATAPVQAVSVQAASGLDVASGPASASDTQNILVSPATGAQADHRLMATILTKAPIALKGLRVAIEGLPTAPNRAEACEKISAQATLLKESLDPAKGHAAQRLAQVANVMVKGTRFESNVLRTLGQAADVISSLLDPRIFKKASEPHTTRALFIDDDQAVLDLVGAALQVAEVQATVSVDPSRAFELLKRDAFDVILLDVVMPGLNGLDLCAKIRELPQHRKTPIIFITGNDTVENRAGGTLSGGDDFIAKPFNTLELVTKAATWATRYQFTM